MHFLRLAAPLALAALLLAAGCGRKEPPQTAGSVASSSTAQQNDYSKPSLTEAKITRFVESLQEQHNPLEEVLKKGGMLSNWRALDSKASELNVFARKYGFTDYADYIDCWGRITVGQLQIFATGFSVDARAMWEKQIKEAEDNLKKSDLSAEDRQSSTEQLAEAKKQLADLDKPQAGTLNAQDMELVKKFLPQIKEATKKYKAE